MERNLIDDFDYSDVREGKQRICPACNKGHFVTTAPDPQKALIFHCDHCGKILEFVPHIDLSDL